MKQLWEFRCCKHCNMKQMGQMGQMGADGCRWHHQQLLSSTGGSHWPYMVNILQSYLLSESAEGQVTLPVCSTLNNLHFNKVTFTTVLPFCSDTSLPVLLSAIVTLFCTDPPLCYIWLTIPSKYTHAHLAEAGLHHFVGRATVWALKGGSELLGRERMKEGPAPSSRVSTKRPLPQEVCVPLHMAF